MRTVGRYLFVCLPIFLLGCPDFFFGNGGDGGDPCQNDPAGCGDDYNGFALNPDCSPTGPLEVILGQGVFSFGALNDIGDIAVISGAQGGSHMDLAIKVKGVDLEKSPRLLVTFEMASEMPWSCSQTTPKFEGSTPYFLTTEVPWDEEGNDYDMSKAVGLYGQNGCAALPCVEGEVCQMGVGCHPSACFSDPNAEYDSDSTYPVVLCAKDCAGGVCLKEPLSGQPVGCDNRACGNDGQGGLCGECDEGRVCTLDGACEEDCPNPEGCGVFCTPCPNGSECRDERCVVEEFSALTCIGKSVARSLILGKSTALEVDETGYIVVPGMTVFGWPEEFLFVRVEDMCGNVGFDVIPK